MAHVTLWMKGYVKMVLIRMEDGGCKTGWECRVLGTTKNATRWTIDDVTMAHIGLDKGGCTSGVQDAWGEGAGCVGRECMCFGQECMVPWDDGGCKAG